MKKIIQCLIIISFLFGSPLVSFAEKKATVDEYLKIISNLVKAGEVEKAIEKNKEMIIKYPRTITSYTSMAIIYSVQNNTEEVIKYCYKAISFKTRFLTPKQKDSLYRTYNVLAKIYSKQREFDKAITELKHAVAINPNGDGAYYSLGLVYSALKNYTEARRAFSKVIQIGKKGEGKGALLFYAKRSLKNINYK